MMKPSEMFEAAAMHIREYGHRKGGYGAAGEPCCIAGAVVAVEGAKDDCSMRWQLARKWLMWAIGTGDLVQWNDRPETTPGAAFNALWFAAKLARSEGR